MRGRSRRYWIGHATDSPYESRFGGAFAAFRIGVSEFPIFDGGGAVRQAGRWSTPSRRVINCASAYALALLENLVHWNIGKLPPGTRYARCVIPADVSREIVISSDLIGWDEPDYRASQAFGDRWYDERRSAILVVPSVLSPFEPNVLINQDHNEFPRIAIGPEGPALLDPRLAAR